MMIKNLIVFLILFSFAPAMFAEENQFASKTDAYRQLALSNGKFQTTCKAITSNFQKDHQFSTYIKDRCILFETGRQRSIGIIYPFPNHRIEGYNSQYPSLMANYTINANKKESENLKNIVTEYCKYNAYKFEKKSPQACSDATIKSLF